VKNEDRMRKLAAVSALALSAAYDLAGKPLTGIDSWDAGAYQS
jgi:hypothetical protein